MGRTTYTGPLSSQTGDVGGWSEGHQSVQRALSGPVTTYSLGPIPLPLVRGCMWVGLDNQNKCRLFQTPTGLESRQNFNGL